jgi:general secretion pathway protein L
MDILILEESCHSIRIVRFRVKGGSLSFLNVDRFHLEDEENFDTLCKELATEDEVKEKIILSLHPATFFYREMEFPISDRRRIREILPLELKGETAVDTEESIFESLPMEGGKHLVTWGSREGISSQIEYLAQMDLEPQVVTSAPFHWQSLIPGTAGTYVALSDGTALSVYHNHELVYFRAISEEETGAEIKKTLAALECSKGIKVEQVYLFGEAVNRCAELLSPAISSDTTFLPLPLEEKVLQAFGGNSDTAIWLAGIWALADNAVSGSPVNFRYGDMAFTAGFARTWRKWRATAILASLVIFLLLVETGTRYYMVKKDLDSLNKSISSIYREVFPNRKKAVDEVAELKSEIKGMGGYDRDQNLLSAMKKLAEIKGDGINGFYETEFEGDQVRLKGDADSFQAVNDFKTRTGSIFATADVGEIKSKPGGGVSFSFHGTLREAGK